MNAPATGRKLRSKIANSRSRSRWADFLDLTIDSKSETPLLQQVYLLLRAAILSHALIPGSRLPSTRQLADRLRVSRTSVLSAYDQLLAEGYVEGRAGSARSRKVRQQDRQSSPFECRNAISKNSGDIGHAR
jgi:DNA-binding transcriptional MocR family regulator